MAINLVVAVTDPEWYQTLRNLPDLTEVNFWSPSPRGFQALKPGELLLFKLRAPFDRIVGGGIFSQSNSFPTYWAWEAFGEANGAKSLEELEAIILKYRSSMHGSPEIRCRILTQPFFFDEADWIAPPTDWSPRIVDYKIYNASETEGFRLWQEIHDRWRPVDEDRRGIGERPATYGAPYLFTPRLGQGAFRTLVTDIYDRRCAVTRERTLPALEAAHIRPYRKEGPHEAGNGLLLRRDIHSLFDAGYVTVSPKLDFEVSRSIRDEFENGREYYALHGTKIFVPQRTDLRPNPEWLSWHNENIYRG